MSASALNTIGAVGQQVALYVPAGSAIRVNVAGAFSGTLSSQLNQAGTITNVNLLNLATGASESSATAAGSWLYTPTSGNGGMLIIQATAWSSGAAVVDVVDLVANPQNLDMVLLPSATRTTGQTISMPSNLPLKAVAFYLNITAASGTGGLQVKVQVLDPASNTWVTPSGAAFNNQTTVVGPLVFLYTIQNVSSGSQGLTGYTAANWRAQVSVGDGTNYTYSLGCTLIR